MPDVLSQYSVGVVQIAIGIGLFLVVLFFVRKGLHKLRFLIFTIGGILISKGIVDIAFLAAAGKTLFNFVRGLL